MPPTHSTRGPFAQPRFLPFPAQSVDTFVSCFTEAHMYCLFLSEACRLLPNCVPLIDQVEFTQIRSLVDCQSDTHLRHTLLAAVINAGTQFCGFLLQPGLEPATSFIEVKYLTTAPSQLTTNSLNTCFS